MGAGEPITTTEEVMIPLMILGALMGLASIVGLLGLLWQEVRP